MKGRTNGFCGVDDKILKIFYTYVKMIFKSLMMLLSVSHGLAPAFVSIPLYLEGMDVWLIKVYGMPPYKLLQALSALKRVY